MANSPQLQRVLDKIEGIPDAIRAEVTPNLLKSGEELAGLMAHFAEPSRDSGELIDSITVTPPGGTTPAYSQPGGSHTVGPLQVAVTVGNEDVRYPHLVEYGTVLADAHPFFWPAVRCLQKRITNRTNRAIRAAAKNWWGSQ